MNTTNTLEKNWSKLFKIVFRFTFSYFILFILLLFLAFFLEAPLRWFADSILNWGTDFKMESTGSGDRTFDYVRFAFTIILTIFTTIIWSFLDKKRTSYNSLQYWFQVTLRIFLCFAMILYGLAKVFKGQFADPSLELLIQNVGEMSPMGLAWTFMGHSMFYNIFTGSLEIIGGLLLLNRKTVSLGSFVILSVMINVVFMNFTYDIPVKLFSMHLVLMSFLLLMSDGKRFIQFFIKNENIEKLQNINYIKNKSVINIISFLKKALIIVSILIIVIQCFVHFKATDQLRSKSKLRGIWKTELFVMEQDTLAPLTTDSKRWKYFIIDYKEKAVIKLMNDTINRYSFQENIDTEEIVFKGLEDSVSQKFKYSIANKNELKLEGFLNGKELKIELKKFLKLILGFLTESFIG
ncbi:hypothetical protein [Polaribacter ponticola]|uniref:DoxX family protein n=1 Tax=Polaribacter ponticola TaxID=2978475 RepID=A0ABT5S664_9FLAO|nr:hypothetical protein [Polaribacter sp. MSW5]MDD7913582.1 hypothetical protein [Polaribacter sp. MSW5]